MNNSNKTAVPYFLFTIVIDDVLLWSIWTGMTTIKMWLDLYLCSPFILQLKGVILISVECNVHLMEL